ncbi:hypothetical protein G7054_g12988 [Neopestalotiopsis clavispora]|nr:hypothetical protein G7054_g12988 [Neopestalotiopsis clavispora]
MHDAPLGDKFTKDRLLQTHPLPIVSRVSARRVLMTYTGKFVLKDGNIRWQCSCGTFVGPKWKDIHSHHNKAAQHTPKGAYLRNQETDNLPVGRCLLHGLICKSDKICTSNEDKETKHNEEKKPRDNKQSVDDATEEPSRKRKRNSPSPDEAAKKAKTADVEMSQDIKETVAPADNDTRDGDQVELMTREMADLRVTEIDADLERLGSHLWEILCTPPGRSKDRPSRTTHRSATGSPKISKVSPENHWLLDPVGVDTLYPQEHDSLFGGSEASYDVDLAQELEAELEAEDSCGTQDSNEIKVLEGLFQRGERLWARLKGSRDGQTEFEWTDHKFQRFTDALASRREELGEQMSELALQEGSQDESRMEREEVDLDEESLKNEDTAMANGDENTTEPDSDLDESDKGSSSVDSVLGRDSVSPLAVTAAASLGILCIAPWGGWSIMMRPPSLSRPLCLLLKCLGMPVLGKFFTFSTAPSCRYRLNWDSIQNSPLSHWPTVRSYSRFGLFLFLFHLVCLLASILIWTLVVPSATSFTILWLKSRPAAFAPSAFCGFIHFASFTYTNGDNHTFIACAYFAPATQHL